MEKIFKALADGSRRKLLDSLFGADGQTLGQMCSQVRMSRQATSKHLGILENAGLVVTHWLGREKLHFLNPVPVQEISERWIAKYAARRSQAVTALKRALENDNDE